MRVVAGKYGSRPLKVVPGQNTRPTTDKIKESIFNLLGSRCHSGIVLDLYGGTGGLAIEAVSRGMDHAVICEKHRAAIATIKHNIEITKETERFTLLAGDNYVSLKKYQTAHPTVIFDLVLIDPPYKREKIVEDIKWLAQLGLINQDTIIMCETDNETTLPETIDQWSKYREKHYGLTVIHLYEWEDEVE
ncbi:16S rRNA (guanine(966)-N(2))-methyltransferase RsmD [Globicatella sanguinis]